MPEESGDPKSQSAVQRDMVEKAICPVCSRTDCGIEVNHVALKMRQVYCCKGAEFARPELAAGWEEIWRLEHALAAAESRLAQAGNELEARKEFDAKRRHHCGAVLNVAGDCERCLDVKDKLQTYQQVNSDLTAKVARLTSVAGKLAEAARKLIETEAAIRGTKFPTLESALSDFDKL